MPITVSIVEDQEQLRTTLARVLNRAEGFKCVSHYGSAEAALEALPNDKPEVVLMDINLPGMNGVECVRKLKQVAPQIQTVMLTVYEDTETFSTLSPPVPPATCSSAPAAPNCWSRCARCIAAVRP